MPSGRVIRFGRQLSRSQRLVAAAFHGAGHAVAAYHVKVRFRRIVIGKNTGKELGWLELWLTPQGAADGVVDVRAEHAIERSVIVLLAGSQAERMALGSAKYLDSGLDFFEAVRCRLSLSHETGAERVSSVDAAAGARAGGDPNVAPAH